MPAIAWLVVVALFSGPAFASDHTGSLLFTVLGWLGIKASATQLVLLHYLIRKASHFVVYGVLSALFFRAFRGPLPDTMWRITWPQLALAVCLVTASADEIHQLYTPGRGGSVWDVVLDMAGALFAQLVILVVYLGKKGRKAAVRR